MNIIDNNIWIFLNNEWVKGIIINNEIYIEEEGEEKKINKEKKKIELRDDKNIKKINNLVNLIHLNEPSILETLLYRYKNDKIYTLMGNILISINPYKNVNIYNKKIIKKYNRERSNNLEAHIYSIIKEAYENLLKNKKNQSIIVSGVSGAGKTYNCKKIMEYLSVVNEKEELMNSIERKIIESNIILESFGNAKTISNNNSSRFGKYVKILFDKELNLIGGEIEICLLEKTRVINQEEKERNFHIFYEILKGMEEEKLKKYNLERDYKKYEYLKRSNCDERTDNVNDKEEFKKLENALEIFNINKEEIYSIISGILHIGNIKIEKGEIKNNEELKIISKLLKIEESKLKEIFLFKKIRVDGELIKKKLNMKESNNIKDTLSKIIYNRLFNNLVEEINKLIKREEGEYYIGILDIFGFEVFKKNNYEQFNINYANEKLQQEFNNYVFKEEQKVYNKEKIDWKEIKFPNNDKCIDIFENNMGIYKMLDEECMIPGGNVENLYNKLIKKYEKDNIVKFLKKDYINKRIIINHYVGEVTYDINNFCIKNKNILNIDLINLLENSEILILKEINKEIKIKRSKIYSDSISYKFINQLNNFIKSIKKTESHYIRCIKPNKNDLINNVIKSLILEQLTYSGILETVKI